MTVVARNLMNENEVKDMTATTISALVEAPFEAGSRPGIVDRTVMRVSLAMLIWARHHATLSPERHSLLMANQAGADSRRHDAALLVSRIR